jgi:hypothetical protein
VEYDRWTLSSFGGKVALRTFACLAAWPVHSAAVASARNFFDAVATSAAMESKVRPAAATACGSPSIGTSWLVGTQ